MISEHKPLPLDSASPLSPQDEREKLTQLLGTTEANLAIDLSLLMLRRNEELQQMAATLGGEDKMRVMMKFAINHELAIGRRIPAALTMAVRADVIQKPQPQTSTTTPDTYRNLSFLLLCRLGNAQQLLFAHILENKIAYQKMQAMWGLEALGSATIGGFGGFAVMAKVSITISVGSITLLTGFIGFAAIGIGAIGLCLGIYKAGRTYSARIAEMHALSELKEPLIQLESPEYVIPSAPKEEKHSSETHSHELLNSVSIAMCMEIEKFTHLIADLTKINGSRRTKQYFYEECKKAIDEFKESKSKNIIDLKNKFNGIIEDIKLKKTQQFRFFGYRYRSEHEINVMTKLDEYGKTLKPGY